MSNKFQIVTNYFFAFLNMFLLLFSIRYANNILLPTVLGTILLARRQSATFANFFQLGLSQGILRFLPMYNNNKGLQEKYITAFFNIVAISIIFSAIIVFLFQDLLGNYFFSTSSISSDLIIYTYILMISVILNFIGRSLWLAELNLIISNIAELLNSSILFIFILFFKGNTNTLEILKILSFSSLLSSLFFIGIYFFYKKSFNLLIQLSSYSIVKEVFAYGFPRALSAFAEMGIFLIGPWMLASTPDQAAYLIIALMFFKMLPTLVLPFSQVLAIYIARQLNQVNENQTEVKKVTKLIFFVLFFSFVFVGLYKLAGNIFLNIWLNNITTVSNVEVYLGSLIYFVPAIAGYYALRNIVDTVWTKPYNLIVLLTSLFLFIIVNQFSVLFQFEQKIRIIISLEFSFSVFYVYIIIILIRFSQR